jgi:hypothetical protein
LKAFALILLAGSLRADDSALWREYGLVQKQTTAQGKSTVTTYRMKDLTGALAAWEWLRSAKGRPCDLASFCTADGKQTVISDENYVVVFDGAAPSKPQVAATLNALPNKRDTSLPAILTFLPRQGLVPDSARYVLGPVSLAAFAPELASANAGFDQGAEAQIAEYKIKANEPPVRLAIFDYPTPEMARFHTINFKTLGNVHVKRSDVLVAIVFGSASDAQADTLLSRVQYEAKITWNETPAPSPIKPMYQLLKNIAYASVVLCALALAAGIMYAGMRLYRRRYGTLEADEAMTTLHLTEE